MSNLTKLRRWANRDDGHHFRVGNRNIGLLDTIGLITVVAALILWHLHSKVGLHGAWAAGIGFVGFCLLLIAELRAPEDGA